MKQTAQFIIQDSGDVEHGLLKIVNNQEFNVGYNFYAFVEPNARFDFDLRYSLVDATWLTLNMQVYA